MKLIIIGLILTSLGLSTDIQARDNERQKARSSNVERNKSAAKQQKAHKKETRVQKKRTVSPNQNRTKVTPKTQKRIDPKHYRNTKPKREVSTRSGFGTPKDSAKGTIRSNKQVLRKEDRRVNRDVRQSRDLKPSKKYTRGQARGTVRHDRAMPKRMPISKNHSSKRKHREAERYRARNDFRYQQHRWLLNEQRHRRHVVNMPNQLSRYRHNHYRGNHRYGQWHNGHNHRHYDYRYRYMFNHNQWYDDHYYHSYFSWRWNSPNYWHMSGYYTNYMDPYYCPDDFAEFVATLAIGAVIFSW